MIEPFLFLLAICGGIISFLAPCNLATLPSFIAYITGQSNNRKSSIVMSFLFSIGFCLMFSLIAALFIVITAFIQYTSWLKLISGIIIICLAIYLFIINYIARESKSEEHSQAINNKNKNRNLKTNKEREVLEENDISGIDSKFNKYSGYSGSFVLGFSLGSTWIGCITPIYLTIVTVASNQEDFVGGLILFFLYALGMMVPYLIIGTFIGRIKQKWLVKLIKIGSKLQKIFTFVILYIGIELLLSAFGIPGLLPFV